MPHKPDETEPLRAASPTFEDELALVQRALDDPKIFVRVISNSEKLSITYGEDFTRELVRRALLPPAPAPAGAGERLLNLTKALLDDANQEVADLQALLTKASEEVCSNQCRSYFPAGHVRSDADHSELCHAIRAALNPPAERPAPPSGGMTEGARDDVLAQARALWEAVQKDTRGVGLDRAGNLCQSPAIEAFERFIYKRFPEILTASPTDLASGTDEVERVARAIAKQRGCGATISEAGGPERIVLCCDPRLAIDTFPEADCECLQSARAALAALREDGTKTETGWLIERQDRGAPEWYRLVNSAAPNNFWTKNAAEALRFARRADAEAYCADSGLDDPGFTVHITEHAWGP